MKQTTSNNNRSSMVKASAAGLLLALAGSQTAMGQFSWSPDAAGNLDTSTANWRNNGVLTNFNGTGSITFGNKISASRTISVPSAIGASSITFSNPNTSAYTVGSAAAITTSSLVVSPFVQATNTISSALVIGSGLNIANNGETGSFNTLVLSGAISGSAGSSITTSGYGSTSISGAIGSSLTGGLNIGGTGNTTLSSSSNAFTGTININGGSLTAGAETHLGALANNITLQNGGAFRYSSGFTSGRTINVASGSSGKLMNGNITTATQSFGNITGASNTSLQLLSENNSGTNIVPIASSTTFAGNLIGGGNAQYFNGFAVPSRIGTLSLPSAQIRVDASSGGALVGTGGTLPSITLNNNAALTVRQAVASAAAATADSIKDVAITMNNARFGYGYGLTSTFASKITDNVGDLTMNSGSNTFQSITSGSNSTFTSTPTAAAGAIGGTEVMIKSLTRNNNSTAFFRMADQSGTVNGSLGGGDNAKNLNYKVSNYVNAAPSGGQVNPNNNLVAAGDTARGVVPWAIGSNSGSNADNMHIFMTYGDFGFRPLQSTEMVSNTSGALDDSVAAISGKNLNLSNISGNRVMTGNLTVNSLRLQIPGAAVDGTVANNYTITVNSGAVVNTTSTTVKDAILAMGSNTGYIYLGGSDLPFTGAAKITGTNGVVVAANGTGIAMDTTAMTVANTFTGGLTLNGNGSVRFKDNNTLGDTAASVTLNGGSLVFASAADASLTTGGVDRAISVGASGGSILANSTSAGKTLTINGMISGTGQLMLGGGTASPSATAVIAPRNNSNSYSGGTLIGPGTAGTGNIISVTNGGQLGTGTIEMAGGTLRSDAVMTLNQGVDVLNGSTINTASDMTIAGTIRGGSTPTLTKSGAGTLTITSDSYEYGGGLTVSAGKLKFGNGGTTGVLAGAFSYSIASGASIEFARSNALEFGGVMSSAGSVIQSGSGTTSLTAANSYTGGTTVSGGTLLAMNGNGSATGTGAVTVNSGGTLGGAGQISGAVTVNAGGTLSPGASTGTLTLSGTGTVLTMASGSSLAVELGGTLSADKLNAGTIYYDQLRTTGASSTITNSGSTLSLSLANSYTLPIVATDYFIVVQEGTGATVAPFAGLPEGQVFTFSGTSFKITYLANFNTASPNLSTLTGGNDVAISVIPTPGAMFLVGMGGLAAARRRRA